MTSLHTIQSRYKAGPGGPGEGKLRHGKNGRDLLFVVPIGTVVNMRVEDEIITGEASKDEAQTDAKADDEKKAEKEKAETAPQQYEQVADLSKDGETLMLAEGGRGGKGNTH